jgi:L-seryl-tRNA(Ser) seleniumtransferase
MRSTTLPGAGEASSDASASFAQLPSIDRLLNEPALVALVARRGQPLVKRAAQDELAARRTALREGRAIEGELTGAVARRVAQLTAPRLRRVINLSGTVIHTNLGRALLADEAIDAAADAMRGYVALEYDVASGERGDRDDLIEELLHDLTGAEAATVVNNNAAAVLLVLKALAAKKEVVISRGELIEIGGAFRLPDIMKAAGCKLVEVGTTNRTHARDFEQAIGARTALVLKAHTSNYAITGFTAAVDEAELARIAHACGVPFAIDLGAGALIDLAQFGLPKEPRPQDAFAAGADVVTFSGDKLLGGPQAGIVVGRRELIAKVKKDPLKRALRCSKLTLAALEATLRIYVSAFRLPARLPTLALLARPQDDIRAACARVQGALAQWAGAAFEVSIADCASQIGSGSQPVERLPSSALVVRGKGKTSGRALNQLARRLRDLPTPVIGRVHADALWLDCRTLRADDEGELLRQLAAGVSGGK